MLKNDNFDHLKEEITNLLDGSKEDTEQRRDLTKFLLERTVKKPLN